MHRQIRALRWHVRLGSLGLEFSLFKSWCVPFQPSTFWKSDPWWFFAWGEVENQAGKWGEWQWTGVRGCCEGTAVTHCSFTAHFKSCSDSGRAEQPYSGPVLLFESYLFILLTKASFPPSQHCRTNTGSRFPCMHHEDAAQLLLPVAFSEEWQMQTNKYQLVEKSSPDVSSEAWFLPSHLRGLL